MTNLNQQYGFIILIFRRTYFRYVFPKQGYLFGLFFVEFHQYVKGTFACLTLILRHCFLRTYLSLLYPEYLSACHACCFQLASPTHLMHAQVSGYWPVPQSLTL